MRKLISVLFFVSLIGVVSLDSCKDDAVSSSDCPSERRTGAVCNDGTTSTATGSGACSGHGGVKHWICN